MADSELLLHPEILAELERYRALERRAQISRRQCQEFSELARQIVPRNAPPLSVQLRDGSPAAELDAALSALRQQIRTIHRINAQLNEQQKALRSSTYNRQLSLPSQPQISPFSVNVKIALCVMGSIALFVCFLLFLRAVIH